MSSYPSLGTAKVKRRQRGDKRHRQNDRLQKIGGHKKLPLPYDLWMLWDYLTGVSHYWDRLGSVRSARNQLLEYHENRLN